MTSRPAGDVPAPKPFASLAVVYLTVFVDLLGFGIILPVLPLYARDFGASGLWVGVLMTAYSAAQFVGAPIVGRLSDRFGRRPILLLALAGSTASLALMGLATTLAVLILSRALAGLFGGSIAAAQAYVADATTREERSKYMGLLGASIGLGFVFGPAIGAGLAHFGFAAAAFAAAGIAGANLIFAFFRLKESRRGADAKGRRHLRFTGLSTALADTGVRPVLVAQFLITAAFVGMETTYALLGADRFQLNVRDLGYVFTFIGVLIVIVQGGVVGRAVKAHGERRLARWGALLMGAGLIAVAAATSLSLSVAALGLLAIGQGFTSPTLAAMLSKCAGQDDQGGILGLGQSLAAAARALGPIAAGWLFDRDAGWPYVAGAVLCLAVGVLVSSPGLARAVDLRAERAAA